MAVTTSHNPRLGLDAEPSRKVEDFSKVDVAVRAPASRRPRLAIVSTFDELCGIAAYTRALVRQLEPHFAVQVFDLDQFFMRSLDRRVRKLGDEMIEEICTKVKEFDSVNIQLEHGTLGRNVHDILRRFGMIARSAPALSVTFHTVLPQEPFQFGSFFGNVFRLKLGFATDAVLNFFGGKLMNFQIYRLLRTLQEKKPVRVIVHTRRDKRLMKFVNGIREVVDHPLAFMTPEIASVYRDGARRSHIKGLKPLPEDAKLIGVFGFLSEYKGVDTVIRAMHKLPDNHHLLIFGGVHPNEIRRGTKLNPYVKRLLAEGHVGTTVVEQLPERSAVTLHLDAASESLVTSHPKDIGHRIHFLGPQTDDSFAAHMAICDHVVLPYLEVGQSSSGVASIALEMGCRVIAARNHAFMQFALYHPNVLELFEIGNFLELAEKIQAEPAYPVAARKTTYSTISNTQVYLDANAPPWMQRSRDEFGRPELAAADVVRLRG